MSRRGTKDRTGYTAVDDGWGTFLRVGGEFSGVSRWDRCLEAADLKALGDSKGDSAGLLEGQLIEYPPGCEDGWMSKERSQTPLWILEKYSASSAE